MDSAAEIIGTVIASKNVNEFEFIVEKSAINKVKKGEFITTKNANEGILLSKITKIVSTNSLIGDKLEDANELTKIRTIMYSKEILGNSSGFLASAKF